MTNISTKTLSKKTKFVRGIFAAGALATAALVSAPAAYAAPFKGAPVATESGIVSVHHRRHARRHGVLGPRQIRYQLRHQGFYNIRGISYHRGAYSAQAWKRGRLLNLRINAYNGRILARHVVYQPHYPRRHHWRHRGHRFGIHFSF